MCVCAQSFEHKMNKRKNCFLSLHYQTHLNKHKWQQKSLGTSFTSLQTFLWQVLCISFHHLSLLLFHWNFCHLNNGVKHQIRYNLYRWQFVAFWCYHTNVNHLDFTFEIQFGKNMCQLRKRIFSFFWWLHAKKQ